MSIPTLAVKNLSTCFVTRRGLAKAVDDVSFEVGRGEVLGLVGESGSGKSMTGYSVMGLVDPPGVVTGGSIVFTGRDGLRHDLRKLDAEGLRRIRGSRIAMVFQDPTMALNPVLRIETQMIESVKAHQPVGAAQARQWALEALERVGIAAPQERLRAYPHQLSGGMRQRVAIAIALLNRPELLIADEPTTALDVTIQGQILHQMQSLCRDTGTALIWISHDLSVVAGLADRIAVMYAGRIVESGPVGEVLARPAHPYTRGLIDSAPSRNLRGAPLRQIPGAAPSLLALPDGCAFHPRCASASATCRSMAPPPVESGGRGLRCFHPVAATWSLPA